MWRLNRLNPMNHNSDQKGQSMNTTSDTSSSRPARDEAGPRLFYPNSLRLYHASANVQNGSAVEFELHPARRRIDGYVFVTLVPQKDAPQVRPGGGRKAASFDWTGRKVCVKLGFSDVCGILSVLRGAAAEVGDGRGLLHDSKDATTVIYFSQGKDRPGTFALCLSRKLKSGGDPVRLRFAFSPSEALGLRLLLEQALFPMTFGFAAEGTGSFRQETPEATAFVDEPGESPGEPLF